MKHYYCSLEIDTNVIVFYFLDSGDSSSSEASEYLRKKWTSWGTAEDTNHDGVLSIQDALYTRYGLLWEWGEPQALSRAFFIVF